MDELERALTPVLDAGGLELIDVELQAGFLRVSVDRPGGVDLEALSAANRLVSAALDELDPIPGHYTLEVSSPGLERPLKKPAHFRRAVGATVTLRAHAPGAPAERLTGLLASADDGGLILEGPEVPGGSRHLGYGDVERARTVFVWGPSAAPSPSRRKDRARPQANPPSAPPTNSSTHQGRGQRPARPDRRPGTQAEGATRQ